jgi:uncharacterized protein (TIGR00270 family)
MCGREGDLVLADVESVDLKLCSNCLKYGKVKGNFGQSFSQRGFGNRDRGRGRYQPRGPVKEEAEWKVVSDYDTLLRLARSKKRMDQKDFAALLNERESQLAKWENGQQKPSLDEAKKIGKILGINLVEKEDPSNKEMDNKGKKREDTLTLGDFIKVRKKN